MLCRIYTEAGELVMEAVCGLRPDGDFELIPVRAQRPLRIDEGPLLVAAGSHHYSVRVAGVHSPDSARNTGVETVYHLTPLAAADWLAARPA